MEIAQIIKEIAQRRYEWIDGEEPVTHAPARWGGQYGLNSLCIVEHTFPYSDLFDGDQEQYEALEFMRKGLEKRGLWSEDWYGYSAIYPVSNPLGSFVNP